VSERAIVARASGSDLCKNLASDLWCGGLRVRVDNRIVIVVLSVILLSFLLRIIIVRFVRLVFAAFFSSAMGMRFLAVKSLSVSASIITTIFWGCEDDLLADWDLFNAWFDFIGIPGL